LLEEAERVHRVRERVQQFSAPAALADVRVDGASIIVSDVAVEVSRKKLGGRMAARESRGV
jgi:hypothetical protein